MADKFLPLDLRVHKFTDSEAREAVEYLVHPGDAAGYYAMCESNPADWAGPCESAADARALALELWGHSQPRKVWAMWGHVQDALRGITLQEHDSLDSAQAAAGHWLAAQHADSRAWAEVWEDYCPQEHTAGSSYRARLVYIVGTPDQLGLAVAVRKNSRRTTMCTRRIVCDCLGCRAADWPSLV